MRVLVGHDTRTAKRIIRERNLRARFFPHMGEASWLILVDLYANEGRDVSVTSACLASFGPPTTALKRLAALEELGLVCSQDHPHDRRSRLLRLTEDGRRQLSNYFREAASLPPRDAD